MKKALFFFITLSGILISSLSCSKNGTEPADASVDPFISLISSKAWKHGLTDLNTSTNPSGNITYFAQPTCRLDDTFTFYKDGKILIENGSDRCNGAQPQKETHHTFSYENKKFTMDGIKYTVLDATKHQLKLSVPSADGYLIFLYQ